MNSTEQDFSNIIKELYGTNYSEWSFNEKWLTLSIPEINDIFGKTLFDLMDSKINVDVEKYSKLAIYIKSHLNPAI